MINLSEYANDRTYWIALHALDNDVVHFDSFGVEHAQKEIKKIIGNKSIKTNMFRIQANNSIMCKYFCIGLIDSVTLNIVNIDKIVISYKFEHSDNGF